MPIDRKEKQEKSYQDKKRYNHTRCTPATFKVCNSQQKLGLKSGHDNNNCRSTGFMLCIVSRFCKCSGVAACTPVLNLTSGVFSTSVPLKSPDWTNADLTGYSSLRLKPKQSTIALQNRSAEAKAEKAASE